MSATGEELEPVGAIATWRARLSQQFAKGGIAHTLARGAVWSVGINVGGYLLAFFVQMLLTHSLGRVQYGHYAYALALMNTALLFGKLELDTCALRFVGMYDGAKQWSLLRGFLARMSRLVGVTSFSVAAVSALVVWASARALGVGTVSSLWAACALLPVTALLDFRSRCVQAFKKVPESQAPSLLMRPMVFGIGVALATYVFGIRLSAAEAIALNLLGALLAFLLCDHFLRATVPAEVAQAAPEYETKKWLHTAVSLLVIAGAQLVLGTQMDVVVVGSLLGATDAGLYQVASQLASLITFGITAIIYIALAMISDLHARGRKAELQQLVTVLSAANLAVSLVGVVVIVFMGRTVLGWFGPSFPAAYPVLLVLSSSSFVAATVGILAGFLLTLTEHQRSAATVVVVSALINLTLSLVATRAFGAIGTASATAATTLLRSGVLAVYCWKLLGIRVSPFGRMLRPAGTNGEPPDGGST
ncbi:MAG TPA: oligosaccharide flippase family protein [Gemmatimonadaceae bacterium]|jgi:O-antigen/teichoic acid export membrane protein